MAKVMVVRPDRAPEARMPQGLRGQGRAFAAITADRFPLELHRLELAPGDRVEIGPRGGDTVLYVWHGGIGAGGCSLPAGSSMIVERGGRCMVNAGFDGATVLAFGGTAAGRGDGGQVHLLPRDRVPSCERMSPQSEAGGAIHADSDCPGCEVWLHENRFPGSAAPDPEAAARGVHSHSEDEIIVVLEGSMRLGNRLAGPGTALAVAADTLYAFTPGPEGLRFINFRAHRPGDIRFTSGQTMSETGLWRAILPRPDYLAPLG